MNISVENEKRIEELLKEMTLEEKVAMCHANSKFYSEGCARLGSYRGGNIYCSEVRQKTFIEVSRNGTKAAAVTWATMECTSAAPMETVNIYLDRPFVYAIVDNATGLPLFIGVVVNVS